MTQGADTPDLAGVPHLVVLAPDASRGRLIEISGEYLTVGRESTCDVRLDDPHVSRKHAALERRGDAVFVKDLGSSGGTFVNGTPATTTELRGGDVVAFATVHARFVAPPKAAEETRAMPTQAIPPQAIPPQAMPPQDRPLRPGPPPRREPPVDPPEQRPWPPPTGDLPRVPAGPPEQRPGPPPTGDVPAVAARYEIGRQKGEVISNVGRDQYNAHVQQVIQQRDSFLRDIAATRTKARWLIWIGFLLFVAGGTLFVAADFNFIKQVSNSVQNGSAPPPTLSPFGRNIHGVPSGLLGWAVAAVGTLLLVLGIVLHVVATSRRRRVERQYPLPMPWSPGRPQGG
jgi:FHA domain